MFMARRHLEFVFLNPLVLCLTFPMVLCNAADKFAELKGGRLELQILAWMIPAYIRSSSMDILHSIDL